MGNQFLYQWNRYFQKRTLQNHHIGFNVRYHFVELENQLKNIYSQITSPTKGLPQPVFNFISALTPLVNVDLLVTDEQGRILLAMRDDEFDGMVWHIPGGIIRYRETLEERLQRTAENELGCRVAFEQTPLAVNQLFAEHTVRGHFISFLYRCTLPKEFVVEDKEQFEHGDLCWFEKCPENFIPCQKEVYARYFKDNV